MMDTILVDTSVWVNFFKDIGTNSSNFLTINFSKVIIATCPVVVQEILQGIVSDRDKRIVNNYFDGLTKLVENPYTVAIEAANLYRELRKKGVTIRKPNDCLIAIYAIRNNIALLQDDRDFLLIAQHSKLKLVK